MTQEAHNSSIEVEIFDQTYSLCGPDPEYVLKLAEYVDSRMREIANETHTADSEQLAVLSAVRIAAEYHLLKAKLDGGVSDSSMSNHSSEWEELEEKTPEGEEKETSGAEEVAGNQFTEEDRQRTWERRQRHRTRRWYERQLLAVAEGSLVMSNNEYKALLAFGRGRGWNRCSKAKR